jgi:folate-binding protein YgfZ
VRLPAPRAGVIAGLQRGAVVAAADVAVLQLLGPGAVTCLQGLLTNDVETPGDRAFLFGALLTPKGMIVVDGWVSRGGAAVRYAVPAAGHEAAAALFRRSIPPRLARLSDHAGDLTVLRLAGPRAVAVARAAGLPVPPDPGRVVHEDEIEVARATEDAPFAVQIAASPAQAEHVLHRLAAAGAHLADETALETARVLAGWPALGAEVDAKTIPQEVRFDEIGGVSYTKGCYTGQETVSRLHFRGHANRQLRGIEFARLPTFTDPMPVHRADRESGAAGRVTSLLELPGDRWLGLAVVHRELEAGAVVRAGGVDARLTPLPFTADRLTPA